MFNPLFVPPLWIWLTVREDLEHADLEKKGRGTSKVSLFIPVLYPYLLLNCHSSFFLPLFALPCGFSLTHRLCDGAVASGEIWGTI